MVHNKMLLAVMAGVALGWADISGVVTDTGAIPIAGAVVQLAHGRQTAITGADGSFTLVVSTAVLHGKRASLPNGVSARIIGNRLNVTVAERSDVVVSIFDLTGKALSVVRQTMEPGVHTMALPQMRAGVYLYKVKSGHGEVVLKGNSIGRISFENAVAYNNSSNLQAKLAKGTVVFNDTVLVTKAGYLSYRILIRTADTSGIAIVMMAGTGLELVGLQRMIVLKNISAGTFSMGDASVGATPVHQVTLSAFAMQETDVTQEQYLAVMGNNQSNFQSGDNAALQPVEQVSWCDAVLFCNALSKLSGLDTCYAYTQPGAADAVGNFTKNGYHLPTEAQWEYACRAGSTTTYLWGPDTNGMGARAWTFYNSDNTTHPVATKLANAWGLYDMAGNVWQWCNDWSGGYAADAVTDPTGPVTGTYRILRGGSWDDSYFEFHYCSGLRSDDYPDVRDYVNGFRIVLAR